MTNQLKLKKRITNCAFKIKHDDLEILFTFGNVFVCIYRYNNHYPEGTCVYHYETPEKGEEFIKAMYGQVVKSGTSSFAFFSERTILSDRKLAFTINGYEIAKVSEYCSTKKDSLVSYSPIPQQEFFRQLRERLKEIVEVVDAMAELQKQAQELDMGYTTYPIVHQLPGYKITIERE